MNANTINDDVTMAGEGARALLMNRYRIIKQLGQGGMGSVWLAEDVQLDGKLFAIKMLPSILVSNKRAYQQLKAEALVSMKLIHPNIVTLRAFEENDGNPFLVMDYIRGKNLDDCIAEWGVLGEAEVKMLLKPIAEALDYAHSKGVVHRDIKPSNVMITEDHTPYILDFGIAREIQETMTRVTGKLSSGTLLYMSPEQLNGDAPKAPQDVYSFAAMVYECIKGHPPFHRGQVEHQILHNDPEPLAGDDGHISPTFASAVMAGLAKRPEARPESCVGVLDSTGGACALAGSRVRAAKSVVKRENFDEEKAKGRSSRRKLMAFLFAGIGFLAIGVAVWFWNHYQNQKSDASDGQYAGMETAIRIAEEARRDAEKLKVQVDATKRIIAEEVKRKEDEARRIIKEAEERNEEMLRNAEVARLEAEKAALVAEEKRREAMRKAAEEKRREAMRIAADEKAAEQRVAAKKSICKQCNGLGLLWNKSLCEACNGKIYINGAVECSKCKGEGHWSVSDVCPDCKGKRKLLRDCSSCRGKRTVVCSSCNGSGGTFMRRYVPGINGHNRALRRVKVNCDYCNGRGKVNCWACNGGVYEDCSKCNATGRALVDRRCQDCSGSGRVTQNAPCRTCDGGYRYCPVKCSFCGGQGLRALGGDEKQDPFDGISVQMPITIDYLPFALVRAIKIPQGWRATFSFYEDDSTDSSNAVHSYAKIGEEIRGSGWIFVSYNQNMVQREVPGVSGMFRTVDASEAVIARKTDGKRVALIMSEKNRIPVDVTAIVHACDKGGKKEKFIAKEGMKFDLDGHKFVIKEVGHEDVTIEDLSSKKTRIVKPKCYKGN